MEKFDIVIIGGGHNGLTAAAYLSKAGMKVAVVESRLEIGGGMDHAEPIPGFGIDPHATILFSRAAPAWEQLELWKYGFRVAHWKEVYCAVTSDARALSIPCHLTNPESYRRDIEMLRKWSKKDADVWGGLWEGLLPYMDEILRSIFYTPPWPRGVEAESDAMDLPWAQVFNKALGGMFSREWLELSLAEILDSIMETGTLKGFICFMAYYCGAAPQWEGVAIPSLAGMLAGLYSFGTPYGGMHVYGHAIARCAFAHGARVLTNCPVEEIIVKDGKARGVRLRDDAVYKEKVLLADKAVISCVDVQQTFLSLLGRDTVDPAFIQKISDLGLKGGSLYELAILCEQAPKLRGEAGKIYNDLPYYGFWYPLDSIDDWHRHVQEIDGKRITPEIGAGHLGIAVNVPSAFDPTRAPEGYNVISPMTISVPPPEYHVGGPEAVNNEREIINAKMMNMLRDIAPNMTDANIIATYLSTPLEQEFRNAGFCGGNWYSAAQSTEQWWTGRPLPELSRYRTSIENLYLGHQTCYPGGLCYMAVPYNLMHILIDDGVVEAPSWWYPSRWHIKDGDHGIPRIEEVLEKSK